jgi:hypothetical protein
MYEVNDHDNEASKCEVMSVEVLDETDGYRPVEVWCARVLSFVILFQIINYGVYLPFVICR